MPLEERLEQLSKPTRRVRVTTARGTFSRTPDIIVFQNFDTVSHYRASLTFQNLHQV